MRGPKKTIWWTLGVIVLAQAGRPLLNALLDGETVNEWALGITLLALGFLAGLVAQDFANPTSWVWDNWREWTRSFEVVVCRVNKEQHPLRDAVNVRLRLVKDIDGGALRVSAYSNTGRRQPPILKHLLIEQRAFSKGEEIDLTLALVSRERSWTIAVEKEWAELDPEKQKRWILGSSNNLVEIALGKGFRKQTERFEVVEPDQLNSGFNTHVRWQGDRAFDLTGMP